MPALTLYHATRAQFDAFDPKKTVDGGIHLGTEAQARMRGGKAARLIQAEVNVDRPRRSRDLGGQWASKIRSARAAGHDAIVYLNRYEGLSLERILEAQRDGVDLDRLSDAQFKRRVPEAQDSYIVLDPSQIRVLNNQAGQAPALPVVTASFPRASLATVTHVGSLRPSDKGRQGDSYEGDGLSFSKHPQAWVEIAHLGGQPWWEADMSHLRVLDGHASLKDPQLRAVVEDWAQAQGWATRVTAHKVTWLDTEINRRMSVWCATAEEARREAESCEGRARIVKAWAPTQALLDRLGHKHTPPDVANPHTDQAFLTVWAQEHGWDGMWWADRLRPKALSAPRGVIFPTSLNRVTWTPSPQSPPPVAEAPRQRRRVSP